LAPPRLTTTRQPAEWVAGPAEHPARQDAWPADH